MASVRKRKIKRKKNRLGVAAVGFVAVIMVVVLGIQTIELKQKDKGYQEREARLAEQIASEEQRGQELSEQQVYIHTKQYIEELARQKFGLVKPDEVLIKGKENQ